MRYTRLKRQIEGGTLIGTHGTPFAGGAEKIAEAMRKRKKGGGGQNAFKNDENRNSSSVESDRGESDNIYETAGGEDKGREDGGRKRVAKVKIEDGIYSVGGQYESEGESQSESEEDSDEDKPLMKRRGRPASMIGLQIKDQEMEVTSLRFPTMGSATENVHESRQVSVMPDPEYISRQPEQVTELETDMIGIRYQNLDLSLLDPEKSKSYDTTNIDSSSANITSNSNSDSPIPQSSCAAHPPFIHQIRPYNHSDSYFQHQAPFVDIPPEFSYRMQQRSGGVTNVQYDFVPIPSSPPEIS